MIILACIPCMRKRFSKDISSPITVNILLCTDTILAQYDGLRIPDVSFPFRIPESSHLQYSLPLKYSFLPARLLQCRQPMLCRRSSNEAFREGWRQTSDYSSYSWMRVASTSDWFQQQEYRFDEQYSTGQWLY